MNGDMAHRLRAAHRQVTAALLAELGSEGHWTGELSSSALATATAATALAAVDRRQHAGLIRKGLDWLAAHANPDGGWGDTLRSRSNLSTTALAWAAFGAAEADADYPHAVAGAMRYAEQAAGSLDRLVPAIEALYGKDRTFSVPITMMLALSGRLGTGGWQRVRPLPFELAVLPRWLFGALRLPVVSYALPALIAIGQVIHHRSGRSHPLRTLAGPRTLTVLESLQPTHGGFLEATPLTSFVTMSLAGMGQGNHPVAQRGIGFLRQSARADGSWPIDTNLATWLTTMAIDALSERAADGSGEAIALFRTPQRERLRAWLLGQQYRTRHPYTDAAPGGWAWTDLPGGVPDADDTAGALMALHHLAASEEAGETIAAASAGVKWLLGLQNSDGGVPTFCRGWGTLPFDRSSPELTAHAVKAWQAWLPVLPAPVAGSVRPAVQRAIRYLMATQRPDGAWLPLWFGNEAAPNQENPAYGTARVLAVLAERRGQSAEVDCAVSAAALFLEGAQQADGSWGGDRDVRSSVEETALAVVALAGCAGREQSVRRGAAWLVDRVERGEHTAASPIGLYFARLWYYERLYPVIFVAKALGRALGEGGPGSRL